MTRTRNLKAALILLMAGSVTTAAQAELLPDTKRGASRSLHPGVTYTQYRRAGASPLILHVVSFDLKAHPVRFAVSPSAQSLTRDERAQGIEYVLRTTTHALKDTGADLAINASYFFEVNDTTPGYQEGDRASVIGAILAEGKIVAPARGTSGGAQALISMACFNGARIEIVDGQSCPKGFTDGVVSHPRLLTAGIEQFPFFGDDAPPYGRPNPQVALGVSADKQRAWIVTADGREEGLSAGATFKEMATIFRVLGAADAMGFDGGGSVTLAARERDGIHPLNTPIEHGIPGTERPVASHVLVYFEDTP